MIHRNKSCHSNPISRDSLLDSPNVSENHSHVASSGHSNSNVVNRQPLLHAQEQFINLTIDNCPKYIINGQPSRWPEAAPKYQHNRELSSSFNHSHWLETNYITPIHIHHQTSESLIYWATDRIADVRLSMIDTKSDQPIRQQPHYIPALIQIQAIHSEYSATVLLIEVQHLPNTFTSLFRAIKQLCHIIFSPTNQLMIWGDVITELHPFQQFNLFDMANITNKLNLQEYFTTQWNITHPHTTECVFHHQSTIDESNSAEYLICLVNPFQPDVAKWQQFCRRRVRDFQKTRP